MRPGPDARRLRVRDFDWKLRMGVSSSEVLQLRKPILRLTLTLARDGAGEDSAGRVAAAMEMDEAAMDETIAALEALRKEMRAARAAVGGIG